MKTQPHVFYRIRVQPSADAPEDKTAIKMNPALLARHEIETDPRGFPTACCLQAWHEKNNPHIFRPEERFEDMIVQVFHKTDIEERELVSLEFEDGKAEFWPRVVRRGLDPLALIVASLVDAESRLVMRGEKLIHGSLAGCARFVVGKRAEWFTELPTSFV